MNEIRDVETPENLPKPRPGRFSSTVLIGIERVLDDMAYRDAFAKAMAMTDAMEFDYAKKFPENSEEREAVIRVFAHVRRSEAEFFRHSYSKLRELFDDEIGYLKFKEAPTGKPAEKTVVLWDIDESVVYNDARIKKSYVRPAFFPLMELLRTVRPDVRHGILTSRGDDRLKLQLSGKEPHYPLTDLEGVFDSEYLFGKQTYEGANLGAWYGFYVSRDETERV